MRYDIKVPKVNSNDEFVKILNWYVKNGDNVKVGDLLVDFETSKATFDFEAEFAGVIKIKANPEDTVAIGETIAFAFDSADEMQSFIEPEDGSDNRAITATVENVDFGATRLSKKAQNYLTENKIDLSKLGLSGLVTLKRILAAKKPKTTTKSERIAEPARNFRIDHGENKQEAISPSKLFEINQLRLGQRENITSSLTIQFLSDGLFEDVDGRQLGSKRLPVILFELGKLLAENRKMLSYFDENNVYYYDEISIGVAIDLSNSLKVPVIQNIDKLSLSDIQDRLAYLIDCYLDDKFSSKDLSAGSFTVTDLSGENILSFQPLINGAQSAILGIGMDQDLPGKPITFTMVFDHRVHSGAAISQFLNQLKSNVLKYKAAGQKQQVVRCSKCYTSVAELHELYKNEALMLLFVDENQEEKHICHICAGNY